MSSWIESYAHWITARTRAIYIACALISLLAIVGIAHIHINPTPYVIDRNHPDRFQEKVVEQRFSRTAENILVVLEPQQGDVQPQFLTDLTNLVAQIEGISLADSEADKLVKSYRTPVTAAYAISNSRYLPKDSADLQFIPLWDPTTGDTSSLRTTIQQTKRFNGILADQDLGAVAILIEVAIADDDANAMSKLLLRLKETVASNMPSASAYYAGSPVVLVEVGESVKRDNILFFPIITTLIALMLWLGFRKLYFMLAPLAITTLTAVWTIGLMGAFGISINIITVVLPVFLVTISVADSIHYLVKTKQYILDGYSTKSASRQAINELFVPIALTSVTTAIGFIALSYTHLTFVSQFGVFTAIGVVIAFVLSITLLPALTGQFGGVLNQKRSAASPSPNMLVGVIQHIVAVMAHHRAVVLVSVCILAACCSWLTLKVKPGFSNIGAFSPSTQLRQDLSHIQDHFTGTIPADILATPSTNRSILNSVDLKEIEALQVHLEALSDVAKTYSIVDLIKEVDASLFQQISTGGIGDLSDASIQEYFSIIESDPRQEYLSLLERDARSARILVTSNTDDGVAWGRIRDQIWQSQTANKSLNFELSGFGQVMQTLVSEVTSSQVRSLLLSVLLISIVMIALFRSISLGLIGISPLVLTLLINFAIMAISNTVLDIGTSLIVGIAFGVGVDYAIHLISATQRALQQTARATVPEAINTALAEVTTPILLNTIALTIGFSVLLLSSFQPIKNLGMLISLSLLLCSLFTLTLIPLLLRVLPQQYVVNVFRIVTPTMDSEVIEINKIPNQEKI